MRITDRRRALLIFTADFSFAALSYPFSLYLRVGIDGLEKNLDDVLLSSGIFAAVSLAILWWFRLDRVPWRYVSVGDALLLGRTSLVINLTFLGSMFLTTRLDGVPRSSVAINILVLTGLLAGSRVLFRLWHEKQLTLPSRRPQAAWRTPVLLIGATDEAEAFIRKMARDPDAPYNVIGILGNEDRPVGSRIRGVTVVGSLGDLAPVIDRLTQQGMRPERLIIADPGMRGQPVRDLLDQANSLSIPLNRLPELSQFQDAAGDAIQVRPVAVEDLLSRPQAYLNREAVETLVGGKRVLITGAGGSIGSELVRQIAALGPAHLTLLDNSEFNLYEIDRELGETHPALPRSARLGNVRDRAHLDWIFGKERPELVFHAAALKHVPLLESQPTQAVLTNVLGTRNVADTCRRHAVEAMVMISTDKATHPVNVMGATKRTAESYCQSLDIDLRADGTQGGTRFVTVRFGNVLGSAGSVIPLFQKQLEKGGPLTVTHPDMTRYFMTIREAVELVLQAATLHDRELERGGAIVVLDMGEPVSIVKMATQMIKLAGLVPGKDIDIVYTGLRPGERLTENLFEHSETLLRSSHKGLMIARPQVADHAFVARAIDQLVEAAVAQDESKVLQLIARIVPGFGDQDTALSAGGGRPIIP